MSCQVSDKKCQMGTACVDIDSDCPFSNELCCQWMRMKAITEAIFNPIQTFNILYQKAVEWVRAWISYERMILPIAAAIAVVAGFLYVASYIGGWYGFFMLLFS